EAPVANAFALPGGFIFITDKLLKLNLSDDELAFLLGHEISHVQNRHFERMQVEQKKVSFLNALASIGALIIASQAKNQDYKRLKEQGALYRRHDAPPIERQEHAELPPHLVPLMAGNIFGTLYLLHSQREYEFEADNTGGKIAIKAGYTLSAGIGMLEKLFYTNYRDARYLKWQTHPLTNSRIEALQEKIKTEISQRPKSEAYMTLFKDLHADRILNLYEKVGNLPKPTMLSRVDVSFSRLRKILLSRAARLTTDKESKRRALRLKIKNHFEPEIKKRPFLLGDYGILCQSLEELQELGGAVSNDWIEEYETKKNQSLNAHLDNISKATPGYKQLDYMIKNFAEHELCEEWKFQRWVREPVLKTKISQGRDFLDNPKYKKAVKKELENIISGKLDNPWVYRKVISVLQHKADKKKLTEIAKKCEDLEHLALYMHEFPDDEFLSVILERKRELANLRYQAGRLSSLSQQKHKAVEAYRDILLYDSGSDLEEEARRQIYRLNTLQNTSY
ncbi:MAG: M48 family metallopeptidase, partial [Planctomycetes bacterium]|nr:M48 family metallopeptidase [Planctomycetota bacterium]